MPPGPAYNIFCVAQSVVDILSNAAHIRAAQLASRSSKSTPTINRHGQTHRRGVVDTVSTSILPASLANDAGSLRDSARFENPTATNNDEKLHEATEIYNNGAKLMDASSSPIVEAPVVAAQFASPRDEVNEPILSVTALEDAPTSVSSPVPLKIIDHVYPVPEPQDTALQPPPIRHLQSSKVPSSRVGRLFHYGGLAASLGYGAATELLRRSTNTSHNTGAAPQSLMLTEGNVKRLVSKLTQMRGAALKLGQFMSIQDSHVLPPEIEDIFRRVQDSAHYMPDWQMEEVLQSSLGPTWADNFSSFDRIPFAAASIGQVHSAVLAPSSSPTGVTEPVAVKIQFPNIVNSIASDLSYVKMLLTAGSLLPKGLFLDRTVQVMKEELADECDYTREASFLRRFALPSHLGGDPRFKVPWVWEGSTDHVLVMEYVDGVSVGGSTIDRLSQRDRNDIASRIVELCFKELFVFRLMQTDPNWTNFLWNSRTRQIELVDFGATREYSREFIDDWLRLLSAAAADDREACIEWSLKLGYLTGKEEDVMLDAHVRSMTLLATPFRADTPQPFAFGPGSQWAEITAEIRAQIPVMLRHRLTPPPRETYSLNRKLSGAFLLAARLDAKVDCKMLWDGAMRGYQFAGSSESKI